MSILDKASLIQIPSGYKSGKLYSIKPDNGDGDFTFSRSSSATRVNSEGLIETAQIVSETELVTNGDFGSDSDWNFVGDGSISNGELILPCCIFNNRVSQGVGMSSTKSYKLEINITQITSGDTIDYLQGGSWNTLGTQLGVNTAIISNPTDAALFLRNNNGAATIKIDNVSIKEVFQSDIPRLDYSDGSCPSLLLETQRTNLVTHSSDFSDSSWFKLGLGTASTAIVTTDYATSPEGLNNATRLQVDLNGGTTSSDQSLIYDAFAVSSGDNTRSIYVKSNDGNTYDVYFGGTLSSYEIKQVTSEWTRIDATRNFASSGTGYLSIGLRGGTGCSDNADILIYGAQVEAGSYSTSYIPTEGSTVTRTADVCNNAGTSATFNSTEGVLFVEMAALADDTQQQIGVYGDSTTEQLRIEITNNVIKGQLYNGAFQANMSSTQTVTNFNKVALKWKVDDFALWINGTEVATDSSGTTFSAETLDRVHFSAQNGSTYAAQAKTKQLMVFNEALSNEELSDLTGQINTSFVQLADFYNYTIL